MDAVIFIGGGKETNGRTDIGYFAIALIYSLAVLR